MTFMNASGDKLGFRLCTCSAEKKQRYFISSSGPFLGVFGAEEYSVELVVFGELGSWRFDFEIVRAGTMIQDEVRKE